MAAGLSAASASRPLMDLMEAIRADELRSDSRYNDHSDNAGASIFKAAYVAKKETQ